MSITGSATELVEAGKTLFGADTPQDTRQAERFAYVFQLHGPAAAGPFPIVFPLLINPERYSLDEPLAHEVTPTIGGVTAEEYGQILKEVTIAGTTGFAPRQGTFGSLADRPYSGLRQMKALRDLFTRYGALKADPNYAGQTRMTFHALKDEDHWEIVPGNVRVDRNARAAGRFLYSYTITFTVVGLAVRFTPQERPSELGLEERYKNARRKVNEIAGEVNDVIGAATKLQNEVRMLINNNILTDVIDGLNQIMTGVSDFLDGTEAVIRAPFQVLERVIGLLQQTRTAMDSAVSVQDAIDSYHYKNARDVLGRTERALNDLAAFRKTGPGAPFRETPDEVARGVRDRQLVRERRSARAVRALGDGNRPDPRSVAEDSESAAQSRYDRLDPQPVYRARRQAVVLQGDTIFGFAARETGDPGNWLVIVAANDLAAPYISLSGAPGTVRPGDTLMVPIADPRGAPSLVASSGPDVQGDQVLADIHGTDLLQDEDGDLVPDEQYGLTDVLLTTGIPNYIQALKRRLKTIRRTNPVFPNYGVPRGVGRPGTLEQLIRLQFETEASILEDPRTEAVVSSRLAASGDLVGVQLDVRPRGTSALRSVSRLLR